FNPENMERVTFVTGTVGGGICVRDLIERVKLKRRLQPNAYPLLRMSHVFMKTRFGGRQRPHFDVVDWIQLGGDAALPASEAPKLAGPTTLPEETGEPLPY